MSRWFKVAFLVFIACPCLLSAADPERVFRCGTAEITLEVPTQEQWRAIREVRERDRSLPEYNVGDTRIFWVWDLSVMPPVDIQISATCRAKGDRGYVWVSDTEWGTAVDQTDVDGVFTAWEIATPPESIDPTRGICQIAETVFGPVPDELDNDPRVYVFFYDIGSYHGYTFDGFWNVYDQMTDAEAQMYGRHSNECEIVYLDCNPSDPDDPYMLGVLAHEFQHLIHWGADVDEVTWVNEACSQLSWFVCGFGTDGAENAFANNPNNNLVSWDQTSGDYGQVMLFSLYLYEQFGGAGSILEIVANPGNGFSGIGAALTGLGYPWDAEQVFNEWVAANFLDDPSIDRGQYGYVLFDPPPFKIQQTFTVFPTGLQSASVDEWATRYYRCTGGQVQWNLDVDPGAEPVSPFLAATDSGDALRVIPLDATENVIQARITATADATADIILANHDSAAAPVTVPFEMRDETADDVTPPFVREASPWGVCGPTAYAEFRIRDETGIIDAETLALLVDGQPPSNEPVMEPKPDGDLFVMLSLSEVPMDQVVDIEVRVSDTAGNVMTPFHLVFMMTGSPQPTATPSGPTATPSEPTATPSEPTATPSEPTATPSEPTATPVPPTPTPGCDTLGVTLWMTSDYFTPGDPCACTVTACNPGSEHYPDLPLFVILDVYGLYFFAPSFGEFDYFEIDLDPGDVEIGVLPEFAWPEGAGTASGILWYAAMTDPGITQLFGEMDTWEFGWGN
ncbi:hypothetical protein JXA40_09835 [bacterium]|nr:hypothetical protein [candidate division CSSED10-310 bacterium]